MKDRRRKEIAKALYDECFLCEKEVGMLDDVLAEKWGKMNAARNAVTVECILDHVDETANRHIRILNAAGLGSGNQDLSILRYLRSTGLDIEWTAPESPASPHLRNDYLQGRLKELSIELRPIDYGLPLPAPEGRSYDVILFNEIAEHLDYSAFLKALLFLREQITDQGILVLTTPNALSLPFRVSTVIGRSDLWYSGDGVENMRRGIFGHIGYYDRNRLAKMLRETGFGVVRSTTFTAGNFQQEHSGILRLLRALEPLIPNSYDTILIVARRAEPVREPFEI